MKTNDIIIAGIAGTTAFTLFSYLTSHVLKENFKEPQLIGKMLDSVTDMNKEESQFSGWITHYLIGIAFAGAYKQLINVTGIKPTTKNGVIAGIFSGVPAALTWDTALKVHPAPPKNRSIPYYFQLVLGHAIFGAVSFWVLGSFRQKLQEKNAISKIEEGSADHKMGLYATAGS